MHYTISPDRRTLTLHFTEGERENLRALGDEIHTDSMMRDCLESLVCNSELTWIDPSETGDLTDAPMLGILGEEGVKDVTVFLPNYGLRVTGSDGRNVMAAPILERWAWMSYAVRSLLEELRDKGSAVLVSGN